MIRIIFFLSAMGIVVGGFLVPIYAAYGTQETVTFRVVDKERIVSESQSGITSKYLVFTETEVFENTDALLFFKFNSSDVQGKLRIGETCNAVVVGWRIPFLSMYRNIIAADCWNTQ